MKFATHVLIAGALLLGCGSMTGCDQKEEVLDVETPDGELEVEQSPDTGEVEVDVDDGEL